ncbi:MAG: NAD(+) diphosphatase [Tannerellaceae bacterium]|nr:NAD(+) diphosphatase [Tannerellaceae bacterium]
MIQDIAPHTFDNTYRSELPTGNSFVLWFEGRSCLLSHTDGEITFPTLDELKERREHIAGTATWLFSIDNQPFFLVHEPPVVEEIFRLQDIQLFRTASPQYMAYAGITAFSLFNWYNAHRFCGRCGAPMKHSDKERMLYCEQCNQMEYPKISPAVIVGVTHGDKLLMSRYANREYTRYSLLAGFAEIGETIEETIHREVMEEVGLNVKNPVYYKSQPWGFSDTLLLGFFVELDGDDTITLDEEELAVAEWFTRDWIPPNDSQISLTSEMIDYFRNNNG